MIEQQQLPMEFDNVNNVTKEKKQRVNNIIDEILETITSSFKDRKCLTRLNQVCTKTCPLFHPLSCVLNLDNGTCKHCNVKSTADYSFKCHERGQTKRYCFTDRMDLTRRVVKRPIEVLEYIRREKILPTADRILDR